MQHHETWLEYLPLNCVHKQCSYSAKALIPAQHAIATIFQTADRAFARAELTPTVNLVSFSIIINKTKIPQVMTSFRPSKFKLIFSFENTVKPVIPLQAYPQSSK